MSKSTTHHTQHQELIKAISEKKKEVCELLIPKMSLDAINAVNKSSCF